MNWWEIELLPFYVIDCLLLSFNLLIGRQHLSMNYVNELLNLSKLTIMTKLFILYLPKSEGFANNVFIYYHANTIIISDVHISMSKKYKGRQKIAYYNNTAEMSISTILKINFMITMHPAKRRRRKIAIF